MQPRSLFVSGLALLIAFALAEGQNPPQPPQDVDVIRTETDLTNLLFTVTDKNNRYITTLQRDDIRVLEDGVPQTLFTFQRETERPLSIAFLIDVSISEERTLPDEKGAARAFIEKVIRSEKDQAAIIPFEGYAHVEQPLTRDVLGSIEHSMQLRSRFRPTPATPRPWEASPRGRGQLRRRARAQPRFGKPSL